MAMYKPEFSHVLSAAIAHHTVHVGMYAKNMHICLTRVNKIAT